MKKTILAAAAAVSLSGCVGYGAGYGGYGSGVSVGVSSGYGYNGYANRYGYGQYGYDNNCISYDRYGRPYYTYSCNNYYGAGGYNQRRVIYYYPGYTYRQGYYYDQGNRRYDGVTLYRQHRWNSRQRRYDRRR
jgi:hypothetical protein